MGKSEVRAVEQVFEEAFEAAQQRRKLIGLPRLKQPTEPGHSGRNFRYKITYWATPWFYADLLRLQARLGMPSMHKTLEKIIADALPERARAPRPGPKVHISKRVALRRVA